MKNKIKKVLRFARLIITELVIVFAIATPMALIFSTGIQYTVKEAEASVERNKAIKTMQQYEKNHSRQEWLISHDTKIST